MKLTSEIAHNQEIPRVECKEASLFKTTVYIFAVYLKCRYLAATLKENFFLLRVTSTVTRDL